MERKGKEEGRKVENRTGKIEKVELEGRISSKMNKLFFYCCPFSVYLLHILCCFCFLSVHYVCQICLQEILNHK